jgi:hypothetical protein
LRFKWVNVCRYVPENNTKAYLDPVKAEEARVLGNEFFKVGMYKFVVLLQMFSATTS